MRLLGREALERSSVVANIAMNRERRLDSYGRELGFDVAAFLRERPGVRWLDLCCGAGNALFEAAAFVDGEIVGVDLVDFFAGRPRPPVLRLETASVAAWTADGEFDLITCVHGLHYVGDKLGVIARAAGWLAADGLFVANLDLRSLWCEGRPFPTRELVDAGFDYNTRTRRIRRRGRLEVGLPYAFMGADDRAGPNYTGQPAVDSHYTASGGPPPA